MKAALADMDAVCRQALAKLLEGEVWFFDNQPEETVLLRQKFGRRRPCIGLATTLPVWRLRCTHLTTVDALT